MTTIALPSPKVPNDRSKTPRWYRFYAMFSEEFARRAIAEAALHPDAVILDPWVGVGTTTASASAAGHRAYGIDINPVMATISRGRCVSQRSATDILARVSEAASDLPFQEINDDDPLLEWFFPSAAIAIRRWTAAIEASSSGVAGPAQSGFMFTSLFEAVWKLAENFRSKNPTWIKPPPRSERARTSVIQLDKLMVNAARKKISLLPRTNVRQPIIAVGTSRNIQLLDASVDFVLTSPPYCTRIDYAIATRLELAILGQGPGRLAELRTQTMGSSTVRVSGSQINLNWGDACLDFLKVVAGHPSKGSTSYYLKMFSQYFDDLYISLAEVSRCLRDGGRAGLVVQDSFYKGIRVDLSAICEEIGRNLGWSLVGRQDHTITRSMRDVNTRSRKYGGGDSKESVLWFAKDRPHMRG
jgi:DNA modification methylase